MLRAFAVENFRGIRSLHIENLGRINIMVGRNNSSKSSVLEALTILMAGKGGGNLLTDILRRVIFWRGWYGKKSVDDLFYKGQGTISISAELDGELLTLSIRKGEEEFSNKLLMYLTVLTRDKAVTSKFKAMIDRDNLVPNDTQGFGVFEEFPPDYGFEFIIPSTLRTFGYVERLYSKAYEKKVVKDSLRVLRTAYPDTIGFSPLIKDGTWVLHVETSEGVYPYYLMGEGFKSALIISFLMPLLEEGYLFIDLAEAFHHPKSLKIMAETLVKGAKEHNVQVFLTTHSPNLITLLSSFVEHEHVDGKVFHFVRTKGITYTVSDLSDIETTMIQIKKDLGG